MFDAQQLLSHKFKINILQLDIPAIDWHMWKKITTNFRSLISVCNLLSVPRRFEEKGEMRNKYILKEWDTIGMLNACILSIKIHLNY